MKTFAFVFARGGSKGIPKKNLQMIGDTPLVAQGIKLAKENKEIEKVFLSTDCEEIAAVGKKYGAELIERPEHLAHDNAPEFEAWKHAVKVVEEKYGAFECFLSLPPTSPLRNNLDIKNCMNLFKDGPNLDMVLTMTHASRSPWFNMVKQSEDETISLLVSNSKGYVRRQDAPIGYDLTTVAYLAKPQFLKNNQKIWDGKVGGVLIPPERAIDIDTELDLKIARLLYNSQD